MLEALEPLVEAWRPDVIVHDAAELAAPFVAASAGIPSVCHGFGEVVLEASVRRAATIMEPAWTARGLAADPYAGSYRGLYVDIYPPSLGAEDMAHIPRWQLRRPADGPMASGSLVYVTFGTVFNAVDDEFRAAVLGAAAAADEVLVTVGEGGDPAAVGAVPGNVRVERFVPQAEVLPRCAAVVCHAGSGTLLASLAHGIPLVCLPRGADQFSNAANVARLGAGSALIGDQITEAAVQAAIERAVSSGDQRAAARGLAAGDRGHAVRRRGGGRHRGLRVRGLSGPLVVGPGPMAALGDLAGAGLLGSGGARARADRGSSGGSGCASGRPPRWPSRARYLAECVAGWPVLVVRDSAGALRGFHNVCRHRAGPLVDDGPGSGRAFVCRYHGWSYELDGSLRSARDAGLTADEIDGLGLLELRAAEWRGLLFVTLDADAPAHRGVARRRVRRAVRRLPDGGLDAGRPPDPRRSPATGRPTATTTSRGTTSPSCTRGWPGPSTRRPTRSTWRTAGSGTRPPPARAPRPPACGCTTGPTWP